MAERTGDKVIIVSADSHAGMPKELWAEYLDPKFHDLLPSLTRDNEVYPTAIALLGRLGGASSLPEVMEAHTEGYHGLHYAVLRLADMDEYDAFCERLFTDRSNVARFYTMFVIRTAKEITAIPQ